MTRFLFRDLHERPRKVRIISIQDCAGPRERCMEGAQDPLPRSSKTSAQGPLPISQKRSLLTTQRLLRSSKVSLQSRSVDFCRDLRRGASVGLFLKVLWTFLCSREVQDLCRGSLHKTSLSVSHALGWCRCHDGVSIAVCRLGGVLVVRHW